MLSTLLMPNWTVKPTAPRAMTAPAASPKPTAAIRRATGPPDRVGELSGSSRSAAEEPGHLVARDHAHLGRAAVGLELVGRELAREVVVAVEVHLADHAHVLDLL